MITIQRQRHLLRQYLWLVVLLVAAVVVDALPAGFADEGIADCGDQAITGLFVPNPRKNDKPLLIVARQDGKIYGFEAPDTATTRITIGDISSIICNNGPRGILSIVAHPDFSGMSPYLYVWYTRFAPNCPENAVTGPSNRLSRFTINKNSLTLEMESELVLLEAPPSEYAVHGGGAMAFGSDNLIYLAIGDGGNIKEAANLKNLHGKLVCVTPNGSVPPTNPYTDASGGKGVSCRKNKGRVPASAPLNSVCEEIYSYGLRNPFRLGVDPNTIDDSVRFAIADVGNAVFEEINYGGTGYKGTNYGWSAIEGPCVRNSLTDCPLPKIGETDPFYYYQHGSNGGAVTGAVYVPNNIWPAKFKFMYTEYVEGTIMNLIADPSVGCRTCKPPRPSFRNETFHRFDRIVDIFFGPYKETEAMYYISRQANEQNIRRIRYIGGTNRPPLAKITISKENYAKDEVVNFVGSSSSDPEGGALRYLWKFGDGRTSTVTNPNISYSNLGTYTVELLVTDSTGLVTKDFVEISIGTPPTAVIDSPIANAQFIVGQNIRLKGRGNDSANRILSANQLFWEVRLRHAGHYHPFLPLKSGNDFDLFPAPPPEDFMAATNSFLQIFLTTIDSNGVKKTVQRNVYPKKVLLDIDSTPRGLKVLVGGFNVVTPTTVTAWQNQNLKLEVEDQGTNTFGSWNIGGPRERMYLVPPLNTTNPKIIVKFV